MTGELTLTGKVMPIGGLKEKILAARSNGVKTIIIPERNRRDLEKLDDEVKGEVEFHLVSDIEEVISIAFPNETLKRLDKDELRKLDKERKEKAELEKEKETLNKAKAFERILNWQ
jgi:ATP-dependent Lon protease